MNPILKQARKEHWESQSNEKRLAREERDMQVSDMEEVK